MRAAPLATLASYYVGALPFVLGWLYFWADMSRSPFARQRLAGASLGLAALFLWMKLWQAVFARRLRAALAGATPAPLSLGRCGRILASQAALQPTGFFVLPLALILTLPFGWAEAFYQNLSALADGESADLRSLARKALRQAALWPEQNHFLQAILAGFGLCVFLNWATVGFVLPFIAKALFGAESVFTRSPASMLNTTFFAATLSLAYLCVDPIQKAVYVLRCFYGESLQSGEDLKAELRQASLGAQRLAACLVALVAVTAVCQGAGGINSEGRNPKAEGSPKSEVRSPKCLSANYANLREPLDRIRGNSRNSRISTSAFGFRPSFGLRTFAALSRRRSGSDFGLQSILRLCWPKLPAILRHYFAAGAGPRHSGGGPAAQVHLADAARENCRGRNRAQRDHRAFRAAGGQALRAMA